MVEGEYLGLAGSLRLGASGLGCRRFRGFRV